MIRIDEENLFTTDSQEYEILLNAAKQIKGVPGAVVEIGTRMGGSAKIIMDALVGNKDTNRGMFCIDPYGNIELECTNINLTIHYPQQEFNLDEPMSKEKTQRCHFDYTNDMRNHVIPALYYVAYQAGLDFTFFCLEDHEFFKRYADGVPLYNLNKRFENTYALVFFDGPHTNKAVQEEIDFFLPRSIDGSIFVFDDIWMYDHEVFEKQLFDAGFVILEKGNVKASYVKGGIKKIDNGDETVYSDLELLVRQDMFDAGFDPDLKEDIERYWQERMFPMLTGENE